MRLPNQICDSTTSECSGRMCLCHKSGNGPGRRRLFTWDYECDRCLLRPNYSWPCTITGRVQNSATLHRRVMYHRVTVSQGTGKLLRAPDHEPSHRKLAWVAPLDVSLDLAAPDFFLNTSPIVHSFHIAIFAKASSFFVIFVNLSINFSEILSLFFT